MTCERRRDAQMLGAVIRICAQSRNDRGGQLGPPAITMLSGSAGLDFDFLGGGLRFRGLR